MDPCRTFQLLIEYSECVALWTFPTVPSQHNRYNLKIHAIWCIFFIEVCFDFTIDTHLQAGCHWLHMPQSIPAREWFQVRTQAKIDLSFVVFLGSLFYPRCVKHMLIKSLSAPRAFASSLLCPRIWQPQSQYKQPRTCLGLWAQIWHLAKTTQVGRLPGPVKMKAPAKATRYHLFSFSKIWMSKSTCAGWLNKPCPSMDRPRKFVRCRRVNHHKGAFFRDLYIGKLSLVYFAQFLREFHLHGCHAIRVPGRNR